MNRKCSQHYSLTLNTKITINTIRYQHRCNFGIFLDKQCDSVISALCSITQIHEEFISIYKTAQIFWPYGTSCIFPEVHLLIKFGMGKRT